MIFRFVSIRQLLPFSILSMVSGETPAFLANSALLIRSSSRISFTMLAVNVASKLDVDHNLYSPCDRLSYICGIICQVFSYKLIKIYIICVYIVHNNKDWHYILYFVFVFILYVVISAS